MRSSYPSPSWQSTLAEAKARLNIHNLWRHFGFEGEPKPSCRCPWRDDRKPSFSVAPDGMLWNDFAEGTGGDAVDFLQRASGLSRAEACRKFIELAGGHITPMPRIAPTPRTEPARAKPSFPNFRKGTSAELAELARLRGIGREGLKLAGKRGLLWFATLKDRPAWIITDGERLNAQARRTDGQQWEHVQAKAWTLPGSWASWPIGIKEAQPFRAIALCEGGPDFLAGHFLALWEGKETVCVPVAMLGASQRIHEDALPYFAGKRIRIFAHADEAGREGAERWARQLGDVGGDVDAFSFAGLQQVKGEPVKDLNDALALDAPSFAQAERILP